MGWCVGLIPCYGQDGYRAQVHINILIIHQTNIKKIVYGEDAFVNKSHLMLRKKEYNLKRNIYTK